MGAIGRTLDEPSVESNHHTQYFDIHDAGLALLREDVALDIAPDDNTVAVADLELITDDGS